MRIFIITFLLLRLFSESLYGQDSLNYKSEWQVRPNYGVNIPITRLLDGRTTDYLFEYGDNSTYWQVISFSYFFQKRWGVEFSYQGMTAPGISKGEEMFADAMKSEYGNDYYVTPSTGIGYDDYGPFRGRFERGLIGLIYRYEKKRLFIYPKFSIGVCSFNTNWGKATLKQKNSNTVLEVYYDAGEVANDHFIMATSAACGYKLSKRFYLNIDVMTSWFKTDITYTKKITDLDSNSSLSEEEIQYKKNVTTLSLGAGLIFVIK